jgi:hypothetical protein
MPAHRTPATMQNRRPPNGARFGFRMVTARVSVRGPGGGEAGDANPASVAIVDE